MDKPHHLNMYERAKSAEVQLEDVPPLTNRNVLTNQPITTHQIYIKTEFDSDDSDYGTPIGKIKEEKVWDTDFDADPPILSDYHAAGVVRNIKKESEEDEVEIRPQELYTEPLPIIKTEIDERVAEPTADAAVVSANKSVTAQRPYACNVCNKSFPQNWELNKHKMIHSGEKPHVCDICNKSFNRKYNLEMHKSIHTAEKTHVCFICDKSFSRERYLIEHQLIHSNVKPYSCNVCNKSFHLIKSFRKHQKIHRKDKVNDSKISGNISEKETLGINTNATVADPPKVSQEIPVIKIKIDMDEGVIRTTTENLPDNKMDIDADKGVIRTYSDKALTHLDLIALETSPRPYSCTICDKSFSQEVHLRKHQFIHTGEKPYVCNVCNRSFNRNFNLKMHKSTHMTEKPHVCSLCGKSFSQKNYLRKHQGIHSQVKPYTCNVCNKSFHRSSSLYKHKGIHSNGAVNDFEISGNITEEETSDIDNDATVADPLQIPEHLKPEIDIDEKIFVKG